MLGSQTWTSQVAASLVCGLQLTAEAQRCLQEAFIENHRVSQLWVVLANGSTRIKARPEALDVYPLILNGAPVTDAVVSQEGLDVAEPSVVQLAMDEERTVLLTAADVDAQHERFADWRLMAGAGADWVMASAICCGESQTICNRMLGAVLVGGSGDGGTTLDPQWLKEWSTELGHAIAHASITVLEQSLDMLSAIFPPKVIESLVTNAVSSGSGQTLDLSEALAAATTAAGALAHARESTLSPRPPRVPDRSSNDSSNSEGRASLTGASPFAAAATMPGGTRPPSVGSQPSHPASPRTSLGSMPSGGASRSNGVHRTSSAGQLAAVLRQASLQSDPSFMFADPPTASADALEILGYEDILEADAALCAAKSASGALDRNTSPSLSPLPRDPSPNGSAFPEDPREEASHGSGGSGDHILEVNARDIQEMQDLQEQSSPRQHIHHVRSAPAGPGPTLEPHHRLTPIQESSSLSSRLSTQSLNATSIALSPRSAARPWTLEFSSAASETQFGERLTVRLAKRDRDVGLCLSVIHLALLSRKLLMAQFLGLVFMAFPALAALVAPSWWVRKRGYVLPLLRLGAIVAFALLQGGSLQPLLDNIPVPRVQALWQTFWLAAHSLGYQLPFAIHLPLQLLCLWVGAAAASMEGHGGAGAGLPGGSESMPSGVAVAVQLVVGLVAPTAIIWCNESRWRVEYRKKRMMDRIQE